MIGYIYSKNNKINDVIKYEVGKRYSCHINFQTTLNEIYVELHLRLGDYKVVNQHNLMGFLLLRHCYQHLHRRRFGPFQPYMFIIS